MVYINEFLPNPPGSDAEGEWIELFNGGADAVDLSGWFLMTRDGKKFSLNGKTIDSGKYLFLPRAETKLTLHNTDGALALYDPSGRLVDEARFLGTASEGKSFSRLGQAPDIGSQTFAFADPTPGAENASVSATNGLALIADNYSFGLPLNTPLGAPQIFAIALGGAAALATLVLIAIKKNENLSKPFFKRDPKIR